MEYSFFLFYSVKSYIYIYSLFFMEYSFFLFYPVVLSNLTYIHFSSWNTLFLLFLFFFFFFPSVRWIPPTKDGELKLDLNIAQQLIDENTKFVACGHASNALGTVHDVRALCHMATNVGALSFVDAVRWLFIYILFSIFLFLSFHFTIIYVLL